MYDFVIAYDTELVSAILAAAIMFAGWLMRPRARLVWGLSHGFAHAVPLTDTNGHRDVIIYTASHVISNSSRSTAHNVEVTLNYKPLTCELWPQRAFTTENNPNGRFLIKMDSFSPKEYVTINMLCHNQECPDLLNVRCDESVGKSVPIAPMVIISLTMKVIVLVLLIAGILLFSYIFPMKTDQKLILIFG